MKKQKNTKHAAAAVKQRKTEQAAVTVELCESLRMFQVKYVCLFVFRNYNIATIVILEKKICVLCSHCARSIVTV